jgi:hypothetical protein
MMASDLQAAVKQCRNLLLLFEDTEPLKANDDDKAALSLVLSSLEEQRAENERLREEFDELRRAWIALAKKHAVRIVPEGGAP